MQYIGLQITRALLFCISILPFWLLFRISDFCYILIRIIRYRNKVILVNLSKSFPNLSPDERIKIRNRFYRHFCDMIFEIIKLQTTSPNKIKKRIEFNNIGIINDAIENGRDVIAVLAHYNNWEWTSALNLEFKAQGCAVYHPLKNKNMNDLMLQLRSVFKPHNIAMKKTNRAILGFKRQNIRYVVGLISDQSPGQVSIQYYTTFLNQRTPVILGPEKLAKLTNDVVVFVEMHKIKRGYYRIDVTKISDNPAETKPYEITEKHVRLLEKMIIDKPEYWLWSHKRWKFA